MILIEMLLRVIELAAGMLAVGFFMCWISEVEC